MLTASLVLAAFLLGGFPTGVIAARLRGVDLRKVGSGNVGATNVGRALGRRWGVLVLLVDAAKGWLPTFAAGRLGLDEATVAVVGVAAVLGHVFSVFLKGRGGKGVATSFGAALAISPGAALASGALYGVIIVLLRISSVGSLAAVLAFPLAMALLGDRRPAHFAFALAVIVVVFVRHRENLARLARGEEHKA
jgi:glycerol-3-phosphate acyltransferase PlsY